MSPKLELPPLKIRNRVKPRPAVDVKARLLALKVARLCDPPGHQDAFDRALAASLAKYAKPPKTEPPARDSAFLAPPAGVPIGRRATARH